MVFYSLHVLPTYDIIQNSAVIHMYCIIYLIDCSLRDSKYMFVQEHTWIFFSVKKINVYFHFVKSCAINNLQFFCTSRNARA